MSGGSGMMCITRTRLTVQRDGRFRACSWSAAWGYGCSSIVRRVPDFESTIGERPSRDPFILVVAGALRELVETQGPLVPFEGLEANCQQLLVEREPVQIEVRVLERFHVRLEASPDELGSGIIRQLLGGR